MAKDPAFLFYPNDWLGGTIGMSFFEKGAYMELLMMQFNRGHMTYDMICHVLGQTGGQVGGQNLDETWKKLKHKFIQDENGLWYNERLQYEQRKRAEYSQSRSNNKLGTNQHTKKEDKTENLNRSYDLTHEKDMLAQTTGHMENENENINKKVKDKNNVVRISKSGKLENIKVGYMGIPEFDINVFTNCEDWQLNEIEDWITKSETEFQNIIIRKPEMKTNSNLQKAIQKFIDMIQQSGKYQTCGKYKEYFSNWLNSKNEKLEEYLNDNKKPHDSKQKIVLK